MRVAAGVRRQEGKAAWAARAAWSTSTGGESGTRASTSAVAGFITSRDSEACKGTHSPAMKFLSERTAAMASPGRRGPAIVRRLGRLENRHATRRQPGCNPLALSRASGLGRPLGNQGQHGLRFRPSLGAEDR